MTTRPPLRNFFRFGLMTVAAVAVGSSVKAAPGLPNPSAAPGVGTSISPTIPLRTNIVSINETVRNDIETVRFSGQAIIAAQIVDDVLTHAPRVLQLLIDFSQITGVGVSSKQKYITEAQCILHRPLLSLDSIQVSFPYHISGDFGSARSVIATFTVRYQGAKGIEITSKLAAA